MGNLAKDTAGKFKVLVLEQSIASKSMKNSVMIIIKKVSIAGDLGACLIGKFEIIFGLGSDIFVYLAL